ncbi:Magnesium-protoporphyrin IX monomethyl ester [oxidative] cyclase 2 [Gossypium arboreum]|uniref:Magnesium-protoporphyrin IX monomethyl ester [oxidative] cyclase 2 n=1 Tax=Gossypium arboreum TaxID=29729 RepID=A0A0B0NEE9_GOSAR|nr:Magnesium-protoporphyrin IX monomethyl ester [oxidative] cyclase 2 [Gossypium arboreum]
MPRRRLRDISIIQNPPNSEETNSEQQTAIGSLNVLNTADEPAEIHRNLKVVGGAKLEDRIKVARNSHGQPTGSEARLLAGYLDIIARNVNLLPINYESWHHMPDSNKNQALNNIKELSFGQKGGRLQFFDITHRKKDGSPLTTEALEIMEKLKGKKAEYEAIASSDSSVNLDDIDN